MNTEIIKIENVNKDNNFKEKNKIMLQVRMLTMTAVLAANYVIPSVHRNVLILVEIPVEIDQNHCLHCGRCVETCPAQAIMKRGQ